MSRKKARAEQRIRGAYETIDNHVSDDTEVTAFGTERESLVRKQANSKNGVCPSRRNAQKKEEGSLSESPRVVRQMKMSPGADPLLMDRLKITKQEAGQSGSVFSGRLPDIPQHKLDWREATQNKSNRESMNDHKILLNSTPDTKTRQTNSIPSIHQFLQHEEVTIGKGEGDATESTKFGIAPHNSQAHVHLEESEIKDNIKSEVTRVNPRRRDFSTKLNFGEQSSKESNRKFRIRNLEAYYREKVKHNSNLLSFETRERRLGTTTRLSPRQTEVSHNGGSKPPSSGDSDLGSKTTMLTSRQVSALAISQQGENAPNRRSSSSSEE